MFAGWNMLDRVTGKEQWEEDQDNHPTGERESFLLIKRHFEQPVMNPRNYKFNVNCAFTRTQ